MWRKGMKNGIIYIQYTLRSVHKISIRMVNKQTNANNVDGGIENGHENMEKVLYHWAKAHKLNDLIHSVVRPTRSSFILLHFIQSEWKSESQSPKTIQIRSTNQTKHNRYKIIIDNQIGSFLIHSQRESEKERERTRFSIGLAFFFRMPPTLYIYNIFSLCCSFSCILWIMIIVYSTNAE